MVAGSTSAVTSSVAEDGPIIQPVEPVSAATLVGVCIGAALVCAVAMTWWLWRRRREHTKLGCGDKSLAFRPPHRKPTAVKSPGSQGHYLKKSPSPPGSAGAQTPSPTGSVLPGFPAHRGSSSQGVSPVQTPSGDATLSIENERDKAELERNEKSEHRHHHHHHHHQQHNSSNHNGGSNHHNHHNNNNNNNNSVHPADNLGQLVFKLRYLPEQNALVVTVVRCKGLPARGHHNSSSDPYVKLLLLPDKQHRTKTRVLRNTRDPVYDEDFTFFGISQAQLQKISLHFVVMSFDRYSRDDVIGEVVCALSSVSDLEVAQNQPLTLCQEICPRSLKIQSQGRGELLVSLCWQPNASKLTVVVLKARNLPKMDVSGLADPYVKIYLLCNGQRIAKRKTHVKKRTLSPIFNESIVFEIPNGGAGAGEGLSKISLEFALLDWDRVTKNEVIGRLEIGGPKCQGSALNHWNEVCNSPKRQIADWHKLRE